MKIDLSKNVEINNFSEYIFWSYKKNAILPVEVVADRVILYGEIKDMLLLMKLVNKESIIKVLKKISDTGRYKKRINFFEKIILN